MNHLKKLRKTAFTKQNGKCCYCGFRMWQDSAESFAKQHGITVEQARVFQCTAEHLTARQDGGKDKEPNIAAACWFCNQDRHHRAKPMQPDIYKHFVRTRVRNDNWHPVPRRALKLVRMSLQISAG
jgi:5-methylcytosine-specific restriction endonuclease McrA